MFQTEINAWMQSYSVPGLDWFMIAVSGAGNGPGIAAICIILIFGFNIRLGLSLLLAITLASAATGSLKNAFEMPRPVFLDLDVGEPGDDTPPPTVLDDGGATSFWALPPPEAISVVRDFHAITDEGADGLPSGHVASAAALAFGIAILFRPKFGLGLAVFWTVLMAISRMYLGRHFLADVLLGAGIGLIAVALTLWITRVFREEPERRAVLTFMGLAIVVCLGAMLPVADIDAFGMAIGVTFCLVLVALKGLPSDRASSRARAFRVMLAFAIYVAVAVSAYLLRIEDLFLGGLAVGLLTTLLPLTLTLILGVRLGWFTKQR